MRYLILSDIHSNEEALSAVLARAQRRKHDRVVILGDFVGYGADPNAVIEKVTRMRKQKAMIRGNHDKVVCGIDPGDLFNPMALTAARWTTERLSPANRRFLEGLPTGPLEVDGAFVICHGSPRDEDAYIFSDYDAYLNFTFSDASVCFFGHSHIPSLFTLQPHGIRVDVIRGDREKIRLKRECRYLINPGSIGQPRDRNPDAAFAFYDTTDRTVTFERVHYDVEKARDKIHRAGLPGMLGDRLMIGA